MAEAKIIRIARKDLDATIPVERALLGIKGVGPNFAHAVRVSMGVGSKTKLNELSETDIKKLEDIIFNPLNHNIPTWMINHRNETDSGEDAHYVESNLDFRKKKDIDFLKKVRCYKGIRHQFGLPVRGQRTKSHFRKGATVGVQRKKSAPGKGGK
ncbi:MAG: 30S ribosomal protein S13 [Candidatus Aenigmatarchaeota archaeon]